MKPLLIVLFSALLISGFSQQSQDSAGNFLSKKGSVVWQHKFEKKLSFTDLIYAVKRENNLTNIDTFNHSITGQSVEAFMDYKGAGYTDMNTPMLFESSSYKSSVLIEAFDSCYTVRITKIMFVNQNDTKLASPLFGSAQGELTPLEDYSISKTGQFKKGFIKASATIMDYTFMKLYSF